MLPSKIYKHSLWKEKSRIYLAKTKMNEGQEQIKESVASV